jgi:hypothetical protein
MVGRLRDTFRVVLNPAARAPASEPTTDPPRGPEVAFVAFTEDCRIVGRIALEGDRLSDMLNAHEDFLLRDVVVESLADGRSVHADEVPVSRDELVAVHADRPRGDPARRMHTISYPVVVQCGSYCIRGYIHARPGAEPLASARHRRPMIPLTDASIEYALDGVPKSTAVGTIVVNRDAADWMRLVADHEVRPVRAPADEPRAALGAHVEKPT